MINTLDFGRIPVASGEFVEPIGADLVETCDGRFWEICVSPRGVLCAVEVA